MKSLNRLQLLGNVGKDPEIRTTQTGKTIASFSLATTDNYKDKSGNWQERTEWHRITAFGRTAEIIRDYVSKGSKLFIEASLRTNSWEDKQTKETRYKTEIIVSDVSLLSPKRDGAPSSTRDNSGYGKYTQSAPAEQEQGYPDITDDDIPF